MMTRGFKGLRVDRPIHGIAQKQSAKEHDFRGKEDPHTQRRGFLLLGRIVELMSDDRLGISHVPPVPFRSCTARQSPREYDRNCPLAAARRSATPGRSHAMDSGRLRARIAL